MWKVLTTLHSEFLEAESTLDTLEDSVQVRAQHQRNKDEKFARNAYALPMLTLFWRAIAGVDLLTCQKCNHFCKSLQSCVSK